MKQDRFLLAILAAIGILVIVALGLFLARRGQQDYGPDDDAQGIVRNYVLALEKGDYQRAYAYLRETTAMPDYDTFQRAFLTRQLDLSGAALQIGEVRQTETETVVTVTVVREGGGPFADVYRETSSALLVKDEAGSWKISSLPYPYWGWDWYSPQTKTAPGF